MYSMVVTACFKNTQHHYPEVSLLQNSTRLADPKKAMTILRRAVKKEKKEAAPLLLVMFLPNMTHPLASAKSATDQIMKKTMTTAERM